MGGELCLGSNICENNNKLKKKTVRVDLGEREGEGGSGRNGKRGN